MGVTLERPTLHVEGEDDKHTIIHLLTRHGISFDLGPRPVDIKVEGCDTKVLKEMKVAVKAASGRSVGFVIDTDRAIADRWQQVCSELKPLGFPMPDSPPESGYIQDLPSLRVRVGVWLMPDNKQDFGKLENLLRVLVPKDDPLLSHAEKSTDVAADIGASFTANDRIKAVLHSWLAWQREPGLPYGTAVKARFFEADAAVAQDFVKWFKAVYRI